MAKKGCGQTVIPSVDNTELPCEDFIDVMCILISESYPYLGVQQGDSFKDILEKIQIKFKNQDREINRLKKLVNNLQNN